MGRNPPTTRGGRLTDKGQQIDRFLPFTSQTDKMGAQKLYDTKGGMRHPRGGWVGSYPL